MIDLLTQNRLTVAEAQASHNLAANRSALSKTQPALCAEVATLPNGFDWVLARDGSLTAMDEKDRWWAGCSLPLLAGRALLDSLEPSNLHSCLLAPAHAGLVRAARERMGDEPALFVILPDSEAFAVMLASHDFSSEITSKHLWILQGQNWGKDFRRLLEEKPGLSTPGRFIRSKLIGDDVANPLITEAQDIFSAVLAQRTREVEAIQIADGSEEPSRILVIAGATFRLWEDAGETLWEQLNHAAAGNSLIIERFNGDDPASSSPLGLARAAQASGSIVAANVCRGDAPNLVAINKAWITWVTRPFVPPIASAGPRDALALADASWRPAALMAGWPEDRVAVVPWPVLEMPVGSDNRSLALIVDTQIIEVPESIEDLSSHHLLWEKIEEELKDNPLVLGRDLSRYIDDRAARLDIAPAAIDRRKFIESLIVPAYQQSVARILIRAGFPLRMFGRGWDQIEEFGAASAGPVLTREAFNKVVSGASALLYPWPVRHANSIDALGKTIVHPAGTRPESLIQAARAALAPTNRLSDLILSPHHGHQPFAQAILRLAAVSKN